ncbi:MAG: purine-nucleoside phosphorylase [Coriobacteriia bacterium]|nr:purine-nucleoside phosphorylase [Coriobacteriia bacterium]
MTDDFVVPVPAALAEIEPVDVAMILGSGLAGLADVVEDPHVVPYADIDGFPTPEHHVVGHAGQLVLGTLAGVRAAVFQGRVHRYQGFSARDVAYPVRLAHAIGAKTLIVTNAAGGISPSLRVGDVVLISDHINLTGDSPLVGWPGPQGGTPFVPMRDAYDPELREIALIAAAESGMPLVPQGRYAGLLGPAYETPAEVAYLRAIGADIVGMSTVPEVIAARALGMRVLGMSLVTNVAAGVGLDHQEVLEAGKAAALRMQSLALAILARLP